MRQISKIVFTILGPLGFFMVLLFYKPEDLSQQGVALLGCTLWIAIWWIFEVIDISVTALLPIVIFPLSGAMSLSQTTAAYGHKYIFIYIGGFLLAIAIEKWNLHKRISLNIIRLLGTDISKIILGFMLATAFMSMWISNTATSVMMLPIGIAIIVQLKENPIISNQDVSTISKALMLSIAYSASIGGMATLIGTPPNLVLAGVVKEIYGVEISFFQWIKFGLPISCILLVVSWLYLTKRAFKFEMKEFPGGIAEIHRLITELGKWSREEKRVLIIFSSAALLWIGRSFLQEFIPQLDDAIVSMMAGISLFIIPSSTKGEPILKWSEGVKLPWGIIILFGGGMALASGFQDSGLAVWIGTKLSLLEGLSTLLLITVLIVIVNFLTEITSNLATTAMLLPILAPMAFSINIHPYMLLVSATVAASCAFMLPVATPPNAVVFGSGYLKITDMISKGIWMNIISIIILTVVVYFFLPMIWGFDPSIFPEALKVFMTK